MGHWCFECCFVWSYLASRHPSERSRFSSRHYDSKQYCKCYSSNQVLSLASCGPRHGLRRHSTLSAQLTLAAHCEVDSSRQGLAQSALLLESLLFVMMF
eukprot:5011142-Amphidinium_carterae.2